jgi:hypothetical protein
MSEISAQELHPDRVPGAESATASNVKFTGYLLNDHHTVGVHKARVFKRYGYDQSNWEELKTQFLAQLPRVQGHLSRENPKGGPLYEAPITISTASGGIEGGAADVEILTVWEVHPTTGTTFVTAYPL